MKWLILVVMLLTTASAGADDNKEPANLTQARKVYEAKFKAAVDPITDDYLSQLDKMKKAFGARGNLESALAVQKEIKRLSTTAAGPTLVGRWKWSGQEVIAEFKNDGTATSSNGNSGTWKCLDRMARSYRVLWDNGVSMVSLTTDGTVMIVRNNNDPIAYAGQRLDR